MRVDAQILCVAAVIVQQNLASKGQKICLSKSSFIIFGKLSNFFEIFNGESTLFTKSVQKTKNGLVSEKNT